MKSVDNQSFKDIEYIVVNNGSTINIDDVVEGFMKEATIPIMYIKRSSGAGPHTGKNSAFRRARGKYLSMLDSDDEFLPDAMKVLVETWEKLPVENRHEYREVVAQCIDEHGKRVGEPFPENINSCSKSQARKIWDRKGLNVEHINLHVTQLLKDNMFPEPDGVSFVVDSTAIWSKLSKLYKSFFINDCLKIYNTTSPDSITNVEQKKVTVQHCINMLWADKHTLNHWSEYEYTFKERIKRVLHYCLFSNILKMKHNFPDYDWVKGKIQGISNKFLIGILWLPSKLMAQYYIKTRM
jgi:glycosyltransferase involved in cell wall biosynthesis